MATNRSSEQQPQPQPARAAEVQLARITSEGCARHLYLNVLIELTGPHSARDLADAVHMLCALHGRYPGLIELALERCAKGAANDWLARAAEAFERERLYLVRLTSAVGPIPSTPGAAETESCLLAARHALETLAVSERAGCALGAATALIGEKAAMACTDAVETEIDLHYAGQLSELGEDDPEFAADIRDFQAEELEHRETARAHGAKEAIGYPVLTAAIRAGCRVAIELSKRI